MTSTTELPIYGEGQQTPAIVPLPRARDITVRPREVSPPASGSLTFIMPGALVSLEGSGVVGAPFMAGPHRIGTVRSSDGRHCTVDLETPIEGSAETPLAQRVPLARQVLQNGDQLSIRPRFLFR